MFRSLDDLTNLPYIVSIRQEEEIIKLLMSMPLDYLRQNYEAFDDAVDVLMVSHIDVGYAHVTEENEALFLEFSRWLPATYEELGHPKPASDGIFAMHYETLRQWRETGIPPSGE